jgi:UDP-glucuronate 4-epimerase
MKKILVTGGAGFIGSHLIDRLLLEGYEIVNVDNFNDFYNPKIKENNIVGHLNYGANKYTLIREDITNKDFLYKSLKNHSFDAIIHLAARAGVRPSIENPNQYYLDNVIGTQNILEYAKDNKISKLILASSSSVYGNNKKVPFSEKDPVDNPISPYAATKRTNELQAYTYHHLFGLKIILLRFFTVYGPRQRPDLAIHKFSNLIMQGKPIPLYGDGSSARDYTYIDDIVQGILSSLNYLQKKAIVYEIINIGNNKPVTLIDLVKVIENTLNKKANLLKLPLQKGDVVISFADISKAKKLIAYKVNTNFILGMKNFFKWFNDKQ